MADKPDKIPADAGADADKVIDRPIECTECKRPIAVHYTEIVGNALTQTMMCAECPVLRRRLHGAPNSELSDNWTPQGTGLACGNCETTLQSVRVGTALGCSACYEVFSDIILSQMLAENKIPSRIAMNKKGVPIHLGRAPGEIQEINPSLRLLALNDALSDMLKKEDYEQAAWLRDQIKALNKEKTDEK